MIAHPSGRVTAVLPLRRMLLCVAAFAAAFLFNGCSEEPTGPGEQHHLLSGSIRVGGIGLEGFLLSMEGVTARSDGDGYYDFSNVAPGEYTVIPAPRDEGFFHWTFLPPSRRVTVGDSVLSNIDFAAAPRLNSVRKCTLSVTGVEVQVRDGDSTYWKAVTPLLILPMQSMTRDSVAFYLLQGVAYGTESWSVQTRLDTTDGSLCGFQYNYSISASNANPRYGYTYTAGENLVCGTLRFNPAQPFRYEARGEIAVVNLLFSAAVKSSYTGNNPDGSSSTHTTSTLDRRVARDAAIVLTFTP